MKPAIFHPEAIAAIREFPVSVRKELGKAIFDLQQGGMPGMPLSRPMSTVGKGVSELRIRGRDGIYRVFYYAQADRGILIVHGFVKKTKATEQRDLELGRKRLKELLDETK